MISSPASDDPCSPPGSPALPEDKTASIASTKQAAIPSIKIRSVRRFASIWVLTTLLCGIVIFPAISVIILNQKDSRESFWIHEITWRKSLAAKKCDKTPRLLICAGSNALFGVDADLIEKKLDLPCVNLATHAALGLQYHLERMKKLAQPGDTVLLPFEYEFYKTRPSQITAQLWGYAWTYEKDYWFRLKPKWVLRQIYLNPLSKYWESVCQFAHALHGDYYDGQYRQSPGYGSINMSDNGDLNADYSVQPLISRNALLPKAVNQDAASLIRETAAWAKQRHINLIFDFPNAIAPESSKTSLIAQQKQLDTFLASLNVPVLKDRDANLFPRSFFNDTCYHLNMTGRRIRTERLIAELRPLLHRPIPPKTTPSVFVMAGTNHLINEGNLFKDDASVAFKKLSKTPETHPDAVTLEQVTDLYRKGTPIYCSDEETEKALSKTGIQWEIDARRTETMAEWIARYPNHLFLIAGSRTRNSALAEGLPAIVRPFCTGTGFGVCLFGTGRYQKIHKWKDASQKAGIQTNTFGRLEKFHLPLDLAMRSDSDGNSITVNGNRFKGGVTGPFVVVLEPEQQILCDQGTLGPSFQRTCWQRMRSAKPIPQAITQAP